MKINVYLDYTLARNWDDGGSLFYAAIQFQYRAINNQINPELRSIWPHLIKRLRVLYTDSLISGKLTNNNLINTIEDTLQKLEHEGI